ncbi:MAG TPA: PP2C family protein-serine/threonine phosphatase [Candidatus Sulfotelmatobacter sp.]|jgi:serine phosphatase RsbU (regulator of sigma subunit)|nr:PP2C family protein-serine/threonine phosphatase [Candidatus Sulfotelmatobacter sp.]
MCPLFRSRAPEPPPALEPAPGEFPKIEGAEIAATTYGKRIAGDFYDSLRVGPERILFGLLDVAGRRESNQQILSAAQKIFRTLGAELFAPPDINEAEAMTTLCLRLNRGIMEVAAGVHSCPAFVACYHERFGTLCYTNAGHTPGLLRDSTGIVELASTGLPLGLFSHATSDAPTVALEKGAVLLLVSRGVVEGKCKDVKADDLEFGLERVKERLKANPSHSAQALSASILNAVGEFTCEPLVPDDMTALVFVRSL